MSTIKSNETKNRFEGIYGDLARQPLTPFVEKAEYDIKESRDSLSVITKLKEDENIIKTHEDDEAFRVVIGLLEKNIDSLSELLETINRRKTDILVERNGKVETITPNDLVNEEEDATVYMYCEGCDNLVPQKKVKDNWYCLRSYKHNKKVG